MSIKHEIRKLVWALGYDITGFTPSSHSLAARKRILEPVDTVLDIGANSGQFGQLLRTDLAYRGRILSFEPLTSAFELLKAKAKDNPGWEVFNFALGEASEKLEINIAGNSWSSSFRDMLPAHVKAAPGSKFVGKEIVEVRTLDSLFDKVCKRHTNIYMKVDTQGCESSVVKGSEKSLPRIDTIEMEMSLVPLYEGELLFHEVCALMTRKGYNLVLIEPEFSDPESGQILQVNGIFRRLRTQAPIKVLLA